MSSFRLTGRPVLLLAVYIHATLVGSSRADVGIFTHASTQVPPLSLHALDVDCPRNDDRAADGGAFYVLILIDCHTNTYTQHSLTGRRLT